MKNVGFAAADGGALSVDQAVAKLGEMPKKKSGEGAEEPALQLDEMPADPKAGKTADDEAQGRAEDNEADDALRQAQGEEDTDEDSGDDDAFEPPQFWDARAKARFAELPRDLQEIVLDKENERNQATARALQESAQRRKEAEAEAGRFKSAADGLHRFFPEAMNKFAERWSNMDWQQIASRLGADRALSLQHQMQAEQRELQRLSAAKDVTDRLSHARYTQEQEALLPDHAPELADPKDGKMRREELGRFLGKLGVPGERISHMSALETGLAHDAMQWRNARAKADELLKAPRESAPERRVPAKPAASASRGSATHNRIAHLSNKKSLTIDEAVELHNLKGLS